MYIYIYISFVNIFLSILLYESFIFKILNVYYFSCIFFICNIFFYTLSFKNFVFLLVFIYFPFFSNFYIKKKTYNIHLMIWCVHHVQEFKNMNSWSCSSCSRVKHTKSLDALMSSRFQLMKSWFYIMTAWFHHTCSRIKHMSLLHPLMSSRFQLMNSWFHHISSRVKHMSLLHRLMGHSLQ